MTVRGSPVATKSCMPREHVSVYELLPFASAPRDGRFWTLSPPPFQTSFRSSALRVICFVCRALHAKIFSFGRAPNQFITLPSLSSQGRIAIVTDAERDAVDAGGASDEGACLRTAKSCGPVVQ